MSMLRWPTLLCTAALVGCATPARPPSAAAPAPAAPPAGPVAPAVAERPVPYPLVPASEFAEAVAAGTRTPSGRPGPRYWQNWADYRIHSRVVPQARRLEGSATIRYHNRSPDTLPFLVMDLVQNFHAPGVARLEEAEVTGGVELTRVQVRGEVLRPVSAGPRYQVDGTKLYLAPERPVLPGETVELEIHWAFAIPAAGAGGRLGYSGDDLFYIAYFYPQMAAYDDVVGWHPDQFLGPAEFYSGFGNYEVTVEAPAGWLVMGTGELTNAAEVLAEPVLQRLRLAERSDTVVHVVTAADLSGATRAGPGQTLRWTFRADSVRDVAYSVTRASVWDAARTAVGDRDGDGSTDFARVDAIYRPTAFRWAQAARYAQHAVRFLSQYTAYPYPWSHMSVVEGGGIIGGGMEYPMMTLIGDYTAAGDSALYAVTAHEIAHMWVPMILATDERRYAWLDEGTTSFNENQARKDFYPGSDPEAGDRRGYLNVARAGQEGEIMRRSNFHYPGPAYTIATYYKPSTALVALRAILGEETFLRAYREYIDRWAFRHPYPWDMWNTFEDVSGRDLDWFWRTWYHETWVLDQAVERVVPGDGESLIVVADRGDLPLPARLSIRLASGETVRREVPVERWLEGSRRAEIRVPGRVVAVEIDRERNFPDVDRDNNTWVQ